MMLLILLFLPNKVFINVSSNLIDNSGEGRKSYNGEKFPAMFLVPESPLISTITMFKYLDSIDRILSFFNKTPNQTDCNTAIGVFYAKVILKRTLKDYETGLQKEHFVRISNIINICENILSHYMYLRHTHSWENQEYRLTELLYNDESQIYSIGAFNTGRLNTWLHTETNNVNKYSAELDNISLPKTKYVEFIVRTEEFNMKPSDSNFCITNIPYNPEPIELSVMRPCRPDPYCFERLHSPPSTAYTLSHRFLNILMRHQMRRCYVSSVEEDISHMDLLCTFVYRETVYLARLGYFVRDMFMEHIALCSLLGYREFHRLRWFDKVVSWIDKQGCIAENPSFEYNSTLISIQLSTDKKEAMMLRKYLKRLPYDKCNHHAMSMAVMVMAHGIRYATHSIYHQELNEN